MRILLFMMALVSIPAMASEVSMGEVIGWKFNHAQGMCTKAGVITAFPKVAVDRDGNTRNNAALPSKTETDQWTTEYQVWLAAQVSQKTDREEIEKLKAQMKEVAKTIPSVETVSAVAGAAAGASK